MFKPISVIIVAVLCVASAISQTTIKGDFVSFPLTEYRIVCNQTVLNEYQGETLARGKTDSNGLFDASFNLTTEQPVLLFISNSFFKFWIIPSSALIIVETEDKQLQFKGASAAHNNFLYHSGIMKPMTVPAMITSAVFDPNRQLKYLDSLEKKRRESFSQDIDLTKVSTEFVSYCKAEITHFSNLNKNQYLLQNIYGANKIKYEDIPADYYSFWNQFQFFEDSCISDSYLGSLRDYINYNVSKQLGIFNTINDKELYYNTEFRLMDSLLTALPYTKERLKAERLLFLIKYIDLPQLIQTQLEHFKSEYPSSDYAAFAVAKWDKKTKSSFTKPAFSLKDTSGNFVDIKSFRGKVVYIDFWGSWCKPCMAQMANSSILQHQFENQNVVFLFIDFYDSKEKWLKTIESQRLEGIHLKSEKEDLPFFEKTFDVGQGFPRYALLNKNGELVTSSAPHPNDSDVVPFIQKYLK